MQIVASFAPRRVAPSGREGRKAAQVAQVALFPRPQAALPARQRCAHMLRAPSNGHPHHHRHHHPRTKCAVNGLNRLRTYRPLRGGSSLSLSFFSFIAGGGVDVGGEGEGGLPKSINVPSREMSRHCCACATAPPTTAPLWRGRGMGGEGDVTTHFQEEREVHQ